MRRNWLLAPVMVVALLGFLASSALGAPEGERQLLRQIDKLQKMAAKAKAEGNWKLFIGVQKKIASLCEKLERALHEGDRGRERELRERRERDHKERMMKERRRDGDRERRDRGGREWRGKALRVLKGMGEKFHTWMKHAHERGDEGRAREMRKGLGKLKELGEVLERAPERELRERLLPHLEEGMHKLEMGLEEARRTEDRETAEVLEYLLDRSRALFKVLRQGARGKEPQHRNREHVERDGRERPHRRDVDQRVRKFREIQRKMEELVEAGRLSKRDAERKLMELRKKMFDGDQRRGGDREQMERRERAMAERRERAMAERRESMEREMRERRDRMDGEGHRRGRERGGTAREVETLQRQIRELRQQVREMRALLERLTRRLDRR